MVNAVRPQLRELVEEHRDAIKVVARRQRGVLISLFGSVALGAESDASDADCLVQFEPGSSLFDLFHLQDDLEELLGLPWTWCR
ncbi:MAG: nucleotidyltransferase domain-containing protein [Actinobacteria bacterium]|nr:nucleotidyltransferase domain-containing protein [Actinomycetota bacterium]